MKHIVIFTIIAILVFHSELLKAANCDSLIQITSYQPNLCYQSFDSERCVDRCATAFPGSNPECFSSFTLPCDIKEDLFLGAPSRQSDDSHDWIHLEDLLTYPALENDFHITRLNILSELYEGYISPPTIQWGGQANQQLIKENYRISLIDEVTRIMQPLSQAGAYRRLSLGRALSPSVESEFSTVLDRVRNYPLYDLHEIAIVTSELEQLKENGLYLWDIVNQIGDETVKASRISYLNLMAESLILKSTQLNHNEAAYLIEKIKSISWLNVFGFRLCGDAVCFDQLNPTMPNFYAGSDQILTNGEIYLNYILEEVDAIINKVGDDHAQWDPNLRPAPPFSEIMNPKIDAYISNPNDDNLRKLEAVINVAFLQQNTDGNGLFESLSEEADRQIEGSTYIANIEERKILLCNDLLALDTQLAELQIEAFTVSREASDLMDRMIEDGHTIEMISQLQTLLTELSDLSNQSSSIASLDRFTIDRKIKVQWDLDFQNNEFDESIKNIQVEFIAYDGIYWTPDSSVQIMNLMPSIVEFSTINGTLLPSGNGKTSGLNSVKLVLMQSPYNACNANNNTIKISILLTDSHDNKERLILTSKPSET